MGVEQSVGLIVYDTPLASLRELLLADVIGVSTLRVKTVQLFFFGALACPFIKK